MLCLKWLVSELILELILVQIDIPALTPSEEYELQKQIAAQEAAAASAKTPPTPVSTQWSLAGAMLSGIQSMGRAVQVSGDVVERINTETQAAMQYGVRSKTSS